MMDPALAALVVHDLKNELGALEALLEGQARDEAGTQAWRQCRALRERFVQFLMLYGSDGRLHAHLADESPAALMAAAASALQARHPQLRVQWQDDATTPAFWYFDARLVRMAVDAALHNAARFARQQVQLRAQREDGHLILSVEDDGPGLGAADPTASPGSTGLGTSLCQAVAAAHQCGGRQGRVRLSNREDGGARFELALP